MPGFIGLPILLDAHCLFGNLCAGLLFFFEFFQYVRKIKVLFLHDHQQAIPQRHERRFQRRMIQYGIHQLV